MNGMRGGYVLAVVVGLVVSLCVADFGTAGDRREAEKKAAEGRKVLASTPKTKEAKKEEVKEEPKAAEEEAAEEIQVASKNLKGEVAHVSEKVIVLVFSRKKDRNGKTVEEQEIDLPLGNDAEANKAMIKNIKVGDVVTVTYDEKTKPHEMKDKNGKVMTKTKVVGRVVKGVKLVKSGTQGDGVLISR